MKLAFLGTRCEIDARTRRHRMHTSLLVWYRSASVMIDCGRDWLGKLIRVDPGAIVLTHARPDHAWGLKQGVPRAIITHCGSEIVTGDERGISARLRAMAAERGVEARIAYDGMKLVL